MDKKVSITGGLRRYIRLLADRWDSDKRELTEIADHIDAAHEEAIQREHESAYDAGYDEGFASADDVLSREENGMLQEHGWYRAVDMYKKPVCIGDMMQGMRSGGGWCEPFKVVRIDFNGHDWVAYEDVMTGHLLSKCRHYHAQTVEDVLREFGRAWVEWEDGSPHDPIAEYAAKLQLRGDAE